MTTKKRMPTTKFVKSMLVDDSIMFPICDMQGFEPYNPGGLDIAIGWTYLLEDENGDKIFAYQFGSQNDIWVIGDNDLIFYQEQDNLNTSLYLDKLNAYKQWLKERRNT